MTFWIITLLVFLLISLFTCMDLMKSYNSRNSAITHIDDLWTSGNAFPSVTLCPQTLLNQTKLDNFIRFYNDTLSRGSRNLSNFLQLLSQTSARKAYKFDTFQNNIPSEEYMQLIFNLSNYYAVLSNNKKAIKIMTEVGICYTFNNFLSEKLYTKYWSDLNPYPKHLKDHYQRKIHYINFSSPSTSTKVIEHDIMGRLTIYVHSAYEIPTTWTRSAMQLNNDNLKSYKSKFFVRQINNDKYFLKQTTVENRHCRDVTESNLKLFPSIYSRNLCLMECRAHHIQKLCNCVPHFYSNKYWKNNKVCNIQGLMCCNKYLDTFRNINGNTKSSISKCGHCQPNCMEQIVILKNWQIEQSVSNNTLKTMQLSIDRPPRQSFVRSAMYTPIDVLVLLSGVLSTFLGFCVYSLCDLIYCFTVRIYWFRKGFRGTVDELLF